MPDPSVQALCRFEKIDPRSSKNLIYDFFYRFLCYVRQISLYDNYKSFRIRERIYITFLPIEVVVATRYYSQVKESGARTQVTYYRAMHLCNETVPYENNKNDK